jgi:Tfp pilus assembly pilus retraction ATPase PilT
VIQTGGKAGMKTMNQSLYELYRGKLISLDNALGATMDPEELKRLVQQM